MRNQIFISYSHEDSQYQLRLKTHLAFFERKGAVRLWSDRQLKAGDEWEKEIENAIEKTAVAILLISADFLASNFIAEKELPKLLDAWEKEHVLILPVVVKPCAFSRVEELKRFQCANDPKTPLAALSETQQDEIWAKLVDQICDEMEKLPEREDNTKPSADCIPDSVEEDVFPDEQSYSNTESRIAASEGLEGSIAEDSRLNGGQSNFITQEDDNISILMGQVLENPQTVREFEVYTYCHIDILDFMPKAKDILGGHRNYNTLIYELRDLFKRAGWEGDGAIRILWLPPFLKIGVEDTWGTYAFFVKQKNNGTAFIATMFPISFFNLSPHTSLALPEKIWEENGYCRAYVADKYKLPNANHTFYELHGLLGLHLIHEEQYVPGETHWIANWHNHFPDAEIGDYIQFKVQETKFHPNGFVHNSRRIHNIRNITVCDFKILHDSARS